MAEIKINTQFDRARGMVRLVFSQKTDYLEMPLDKAIAIFSEIVSRCQANKVLSTPPKEGKPS